MINRIVELANIQIDDPTALHLHQLAPKGFEGLMRRPSRAKAVGHVTELLLVHRFNHHEHGALEYLILEGGYSQWPQLFAAGAFGDVHATDRWRAIAVAGFGSVQQAHKVGLQVYLVIFTRLTVDTDCTVL